MLGGSERQIDIRMDSTSLSPDTDSLAYIIQGFFNYASDNTGNKTPNHYNVAGAVGADKGFSRYFPR